MNKVIKGGTLVTAQGSFQADIRLNNNKIVEIGQDLIIENVNVQVIDAKGCLVFPGFIDSHTHFELDNGSVISPDNFQTGTRAAILGGTTTILDFATQNKGELLAEALENWQLKAMDHCSCDYGFHMAITDWNYPTQQELTNMFQAGVSSFKLYMAYDKLRVNDAQIYTIIKQVQALGGIVGAHCENGDLVNALIEEQKKAKHFNPEAHPLSRPDLVEAEAISRYLKIAALAKVPVNIVHLSTAMGLDEVLQARAKGQEVYVETCPQYLLLEDSVYNLPNFQGAKYVMSPPLRKAKDQERLWQALAKGDIDTLGTDHCSFNLSQKEIGRKDFSKIPNGIPGVEHRPGLIYTYGVGTGKISLEQMCSLLSENIARLFGMYPQKGAIKVGSDGDLVIWDPKVNKVITATEQAHNVDNTPYEGMTIQGMARHVFLRGEQVVSYGKLIKPLQGRFVARGACQRIRQQV